MVTNARVLRGPQQRVERYAELVRNAQGDALALEELRVRLRLPAISAALTFLVLDVV